MVKSDKYLFGVVNMTNISGRGGGAGLTIINFKLIDFNFTFVTNTNNQRFTSLYGHCLSWH